MSSVEKAILDHLGSLIKAAGLSVAELSRRSGIPYETLRRKLAGLGSLTVADMLVLARALGVRPSALIPKEIPA